jgi:hypothetical protein
LPSAVFGPRDLAPLMRACSDFERDIPYNYLRF